MRLIPMSDEGADRFLLAGELADYGGSVQSGRPGHEDHEHLFLAVRRCLAIKPATNPVAAAGTTSATRLIADRRSRWFRGRLDSQVVVDRDDDDGKGGSRVVGHLGERAAELVAADHRIFVVRSE